MRGFSQYKHEYRRNFKAKSKVIQKYEALPDFRTTQSLDPFDYPLSSREEVERHIEQVMNHVPVTVKTDFTREALDIYTDFARKVVLTTNIKYFKMSPLQKERLAFLMQINFDRKTGEMKFVCNSYPHREENTVRCFEMMKEVVLESLRAPFNEEHTFGVEFNN